MPKTIEEFRREYDPRYESQITQDQFPGAPIPKGTVRFIITAAQNATPVEPNFWKSLLKAVAHYKAHLVVIPYRYKNPTSRWTGSQNNMEYWAKEVQPFLNDHRWEVNKNLTVLGDIKVVPTAITPLTGMEGYTGTESSLLGHPNLAMVTVATPSNKMAKLMSTTGSCTVGNYSDTRAGKSGEFNHTLGAVIVEIDGPFFWLRHLNANKKGEFIDVDKLFTPNTVDNAPRPLALSMGDTHVEGIDPVVEQVTFKQMVPELKPLNLIFHDLEDGGSVNHHTSKNPFVKDARHFSKAGSAETEFYSALKFVEDRTPVGTVSHIIPSNHNDWLHRWILENDWRYLSPADRSFYLNVAHTVDLAAANCKPDEAERLNAFILLAKVHFKDSDRVKVLDYDDSLMMGDVECGMHGHLGPNGSRGGLQNYRRLGVKTVAGDCHSPGIAGGAYRVGTSTRLRRGYNKGPSGWLHTHCLIHNGPCRGKRQLVTIIDGRYRL